MNTVTRLEVERARDQNRHARQRLLVLLPALIVLVGGWSRRWMSDDGFIYLRVVDNLLHGNGPVFNAGERVEAATGPLWVAILWLTHVLSQIRLEYLAVGLGLLCAATGLWLAAKASMDLAGGRARGVLGPLIFSFIPFVWDFSTSGLETGLALLWAGACSWLIVHRDDWISGNPRLAPLVLGLGPLIRPDLVVVSAVLLVGCAWRRPPAQVARLVAWSLTLPVAYEVFRAGYYGALLPNTAIAKEAGAGYWSQGFVYLGDALSVPTVTLLIVLAALSLAGRRAETRATWLLALAAGLTMLGIVRAGGDFMRLRLLLPPLLLVSVIASFARFSSDLVAWALAAATAVAGLVGSTSVVGPLHPRWVFNERSIYFHLTGRENPVAIEDFADSDLGSTGLLARKLAAAGEVRYFERQPDTSFLASDARGPAPVTIRSEPIGIVGFAAGTEVFVLDRFGLSDPIGSRLRFPTRGQPGHEKRADDAWFEARLTPTDPSPATRAAAQVRTCSLPSALLEGVSGPLTRHRFLTNLRSAPAWTFLRFPADPVEARAEDC